MNKLYSTGLLETYSLDNIETSHEEFNWELQIVVDEFESKTTYEGILLKKIVASWDSCDEYLRKSGRVRS